jgi:hypothetical protein
MDMIEWGPSYPEQPEWQGEVGGGIWDREWTGMDSIDRIDRIDRMDGMDGMDENGRDGRDGREWTRWFLG